jgi:hypothetical protein
MIWTTAPSGDIEPNGSKKYAVMRVKRDMQFDLSRRLSDADQRFTVTHEMVHLRRFADGDPQWSDEGSTNAGANRLIRKKHRWLEWLAIEH